MNRRRNPEYRYGVRNRPPGFATVPKGYIRIEEGIFPRETRTRHGVVVYDRPLRLDEIESYELHPYMPLADAVDRIVSDMDYPAEWAEEVRDAGDRMIRPVAGQVLERDLPIYTDVPLDEVYKHVAQELLRRFPEGAKSNPRRRPTARRNPSNDILGSRLAFALNDALGGKAHFHDAGSGRLVNTTLASYDALRGGRREVVIQVAHGKALVSFARRNRAGDLAYDEIGYFAWDDVDGILSALRAEFPSLAGRNNPRRRPAARRNPSWSKPTAYREDILDVLDEVFPEGAVLEVRGDSDAENLRAGKAHVRKVVLDRFKEQGRDVDAMDLGRVLSSELDHYAGRDGRGAFVEIFRKRTAASRGDFTALVGRNNPRRRPAAKEPASRKEFDRRYWGKDYLREPEMFRQDLYEEWLASGMPFAQYKRACAARTLGDGAASDEVVVSRPKTPATFRRRNPAKIGAKALATALVRAMDAALDSGDLARMNAVHEIIEKEGMRSLDGLYRQIRHDPVDFILVAAPGFSTALKRATGKSRDEWARIIG